MKNKTISPRLWLAVTAFQFLFLNLGAQAADVGTSSYSFGNGCASMGSFSQIALSQTQVLIDTVNQLKDNPDCKGLESVIQKLSAAEEKMQVPAEETNKQMRFESIPGEVDALTAAMMTTSGSEKAGLEQLTMGRILEGTTLATDAAAGASMATAGPAGAAVMVKENLVKRSKRTARVGMDMLDGFMRQLPSFDKCLIGRPNQALAMVSASVRLAGAFAGSDNALTSRLANTISILTTMLRDRKFSTILRRLNETQFWMSMSCLLETTSQNFCTAQDAQVLLKHSLKQLMDLRNQNPKSKPIEQAMRSGPLEGYFLMVRDLPTISEWLQRIQFGVRPKLSTDATFKNRVWDNVTSLVKSINVIRGVYSEDLLMFSTLPDLGAKKNFLLNMLQKLTSLMSQTQTDQNFFTMTVFSDMIPFYLIGRDSLPDAVASTGKGFLPQPWDSWMRGTGDYKNVPEFNVPDELAEKMQFRLDNIIDKALDKANAYFRQRLIVDMPALGSQAVEHQSRTVVESLRNVYSYLGRLETRIRKTEKDRQEGRNSLTADSIPVEILPALIDTRGRIKATLDAFQRLRDQALAADEHGVMKIFAKSKSDADEFFEIKDDKPPGLLEPKTRNPLFDAYRDVIQAAYENFNVLYQRDSMLSMRVSTFAKADYSLIIRNSDQMDNAERDLLIVYGKGLMDRLLEIGNPTSGGFVQTDNDLYQAQVVNMQNLTSFEQTFSDSLYETIGNLNRQIDGNSMQKQYDQSLAEMRFLGPIARMVYHPTFYEGSSKAKRTLIIGTDDKAGSLEKFKAKLCLQTLAFQNRDRFKTVCGGSRLKSPFDMGASTRRLSADYTQLSQQFKSLSKNGDNICVFRDYNRRNLVYWLTTDLDPFAALK